MQRFNKPLAYWCVYVETVKQLFLKQCKRRSSMKVSIKMFLAPIVGLMTSSAWCAKPIPKADVQVHLEGQILGCIDQTNRACMNAVNQSAQHCLDSSDNTTITLVYQAGMRGAHMYLNDLMTLLKMLPNPEQTQKIRALMGEERTKHLDRNAWKTVKEAVDSIQKYCDHVYKKTEELFKNN